MEEKYEKREQQDEENHFSMFDLISQNTQKNKDLCYKKPKHFMTEIITFQSSNSPSYFEEEEKNQLPFFPFFNLSV